MTGGPEIDTGLAGLEDCLEIVPGGGRVAAMPEVRVTHPEAKVTHEAAIGGVDHRQLEALIARVISPEEAVNRRKTGDQENRGQTRMALS